MIYTVGYFKLQTMLWGRKEGIPAVSLYRRSAGRHTTKEWAFQTRFVRAKRDRSQDPTRAHRPLPQEF